MSYHDKVNDDEVVDFYGVINRGCLSYDLDEMYRLFEFVDKFVSSNHISVCDLNRLRILNDIWKLRGYKNHWLDGWTRQFMILFLNEIRLPLEQFFRLILRSGNIPLHFDIDLKKCFYKSCKSGESANELRLVILIGEILKCHEGWMYDLWTNSV